MGLLVLAVVVAALVAVERSSLVALDAVEVRGLRDVAESEVLAAADLELGTSTVRLRLGPAEERVEALPRVRSATVRRADPLTVVIEVEERRPALLVEAGEERLLLDTEGVVIAEARGGDDLPRIVLGPGVDVAVGQGVDDVPALAAAVAVHDGLPGPLRARVVTYRSDRDRGVELVLDTGTLVRFGDDRRVDEKSRALAAVLEDLGGRAVGTIDVRAPRAPVVVPEGGTSPTEAASEGA